MWKRTEGVVLQHDLELNDLRKLLVQQKWMWISVVFYSLYSDKALGRCPPASVCPIVTLCLPALGSAPNFLQAHYMQIFPHIPLRSHQSSLTGHFLPILRSPSTELAKRGPVSCYTGTTRRWACQRPCWRRLKQQLPSLVLSGATLSPVLDEGHATSI